MPETRDGAMAESVVAPEAVAARAAWASAVFAGDADGADAHEHLSPDTLAKVSAEEVVRTLRTAATGREVGPPGVGPTPLSFTVGLGPRASAGADDGPAAMPLRAEFHLDAAGKIVGVAVLADTHPGLDVTARPAGGLDAGDRRAVHDLFDLTYDRADHEHLEKSLKVLGFIATARRGGELVGFALGGREALDLPDIGETTALLAGLCCVHPDMRRQGLFRRLANLALLAAGPVGEERTLGAGRMAHPVSMRAYRNDPTLVPKPGVRPTPLQQRVGERVAEAYEVADFDPKTFVCRGRGTPIGYPKLDQDVDPDEWRVFEPVDRDRGDALLAVVFRPDAPPGWLQLVGPGGGHL